MSPSFLPSFIALISFLVIVCPHGSSHPITVSPEEGKEGWEGEGRGGRNLKTYWFHEKEKGVKEEECKKTNLLVREKMRQKKEKAICGERMNFGERDMR